MHSPTVFTSEMTNRPFLRWVDWKEKVIHTHTYIIYIGLNQSSKDVPKGCSTILKDMHDFLKHILSLI